MLSVVLRMRAFMLALYQTLVLGMLVISMLRDWIRRVRHRREAPRIYLVPGG